MKNIHGGQASPNFNYEQPINNVEGNLVITVANGDNTKSESVTFPLAPGQKLMEGSFLADDGIYYNKIKRFFTGTESWSLRDNVEHCFVLSLDTTSRNGICSHYRNISGSDLGNKDGVYLRNSSSIIISDTRFTNVNDFKLALAEQYNNNTPVTIEYEIQSYRSTSYTQEQQLAYSKLKKFMLYHGINHISVATEGLKPTLQLKYKKSNKIMIESELESIKARINALEI